MRLGQLVLRGGEFRHLPHPALVQRALACFSEAREFRIERPLERVPSGDQSALVGEEPGVLLDVRHDVLQAVHRVAEQQEAFLGQAAAVVVELAYVMLHRLGDLDALPRARGLRDAAQRVTGAVQRLGHRMRRHGLGAACDEFAHDPDVARRLLAEDFAQHRVHGGRHRGPGLGARLDRRRRGFLGGRRRRRGGHGRQGARGCLATRERVGPRGDRGHVDLGFAPVLEFVHQHRHRRHGIAHHGHDLGRARQGLADDPVQHALDAPRELAHAARADHAAAALERVEHPAQVSERAKVERILVPLREQLPEDQDVLARLFHEELPELRIDGGRDLRHRHRGHCGRAGRGRSHFGRRRLDGRRRLERRLGFGPGQLCRPQGDDLRRGLVEVHEASLRALEHPPRIGSTGLQQFHVVLDRDDRIGQPLEALRRERACVWADDARERPADAFHHLDGPLPAEHEEPRRDAAHQLWHLVQPLGLGRRAERLSHRFLDARHVHDALAQHGVLDLDEFLVRGLARLGRRAGSLGQDQPHQLRIEPVLDLDQRRGDVEQCRVGRRLAALHDARQQLDLALHAVPERPQAQHAERVADLAQQLELRREFVDLGRAAADEDVQHVLDARQVLADRRRDRLHQPHAGRRQRLRRGVDAIVGGQHLVQAERAAHAGNARPGGRRTCDVEEQVVQEFHGWGVRVARFAQFLQAPQLAIDVAEQPLHRDVAVDAALLKGLDHRADHPPELEQRLRPGGRLELVGDIGQRAQRLDDALAADPAEQRQLESRAQASRELDHRRSAGLRVADRSRRLVGAQVQEQQRSLGEQRAAANGPQVVQERQQRERHVAPARGHAFRRTTATAPWRA